MSSSGDSGARRRLAKHLLWIDCAGGLVVGLLVVAFHRWLSEWYALPAGLLILMGIANLSYGTFSLSLARRSTRRQRPVMLLAAANVLWGVLCGVLAAVYAPQASALGLAQLLLESVYVGGLGVLEWRHRAEIATAG